MCVCPALGAWGFSRVSWGMQGWFLPHLPSFYLWQELSIAVISYSDKASPALEYHLFAVGFCTCLSQCCCLAQVSLPDGVHRDAAVHVPPHSSPLGEFSYFISAKCFSLCPSWEKAQGDAGVWKHALPGILSGHHPHGLLAASFPSLLAFQVLIMDQALALVTAQEAPRLRAKEGLLTAEIGWTGVLESSFAASSWSKCRSSTAMCPPRSATGTGTIADGHPVTCAVLTTLLLHALSYSCSRAERNHPFPCPVLPPLPPHPAALPAERSLS